MQEVLKSRQEAVTIPITPTALTQAERDMIDFERWRQKQLALEVKKAGLRVLDKTV